MAGASSAPTPIAFRLGPETLLAPGATPKRYLRAEFARCPVGLSLGLLGRKWSLLILRDIGAYGNDRFHLLRASIPGIPPKVLSTRLRELEAQGLIHKVETRRTPRLVRWDLTERGRDLIPILMLVTAFQSKWNADVLHPCQRPMKVHEMYDAEAMRLLKRML